MRQKPNTTHRLAALLLLVGTLAAGRALGHGGVVAEDDLCLMEIGVFSAHFTIYQPDTRASDEFCEEVPDVANALFVLDYLHGSLNTVPVDLRIIRDVQERTIYASWEDILQIPDLDEVTEFYQAPRVYPGGSLSVEHDFDAPGWYIGIVTTRHPTLDRRYQAVFGFHVGPRGVGYWPLLILLILAVQAHYWVSGGAYARWKQRREAMA